MDFGKAFEYAKIDHKIFRDGWNGKNMNVYVIRPDEIDLPLLVIKTPTGQINPWMPSLADLFANDWNVEGIIFLDEIV